MIEKQKQVHIIQPTIGDKAKEIIRVAAYCRVSTDSEDQANSFIAQVQYYTDYIKSNSQMKLVDIYADDGITGTSIEKREDFKRMIKDCKAGKIDRILVKSISRFARNSLECLETIRLLNTLNVIVVFENDGIDTRKLNSELFVYIKSAFAQSEALAGSKRVSTAIRMKMESGEFKISTAPYGYKIENNTLIPIPEQKPIVQRMFYDFLSGKGVGKITEELNREEAGDRKWSVSGIKYILTNEKYVGDMLMQKTYTPQILPFAKKRNRGEVDQYYIANSHEGIIERKIFDAVQDIFKTYEENRRKYNQKVRSIFSKKVKCGDCGCTYKRNTKKGVFYWVCSNNGIAGQHCNTTNIKEDDLKQAFIRIFNRIKCYKGELVDYPINQLVAFKAKITRQNSDISEIDSEIAMLCNRNSMLNELKLRDVVDEVSYLEQSSQIQNRLSQLRKRRINILAEDEEEAVIEEFRKLKRIVEDENDYILIFDEDLFSKIVKNIIVLENRGLLFELNCGLKLKEEF